MFNFFLSRTCNQAAVDYYATVAEINLKPSTYGSNFGVENNNQGT